MLISEEKYYQLRDKIRFHHANYRRVQEGKCIYREGHFLPKIVNDTLFIKVEIENKMTKNKFILKYIPKCIEMDGILFINGKIVFKQSKTQKLIHYFIDYNNKVANVETDEKTIFLNTSKYLIYKLKTGKFMFVSDKPVTKWIGGEQWLHVCHTYTHRDGALEARTYQLRNKNKEVIKEYTVEEII
ncbi:hypothetical protein EJM73_09115 [Clostridium botulinum]|uniref:hypothetical protein n=1 Tax=Clostridium botulinum TaxID=1491 RepID=UPI0013760451|nr:hypothetical protein [Clostridium botulinum]NCI19785.1 hypothetical protein [Clostridium botulinum]NCI35823.1 hypothetical protein [Clostridium botulinum]NCI71680.1 hypothetical protein [Clostridium botulinum]NDI38872.1 hypothetical protein [Clostridium botulinum]HCL4447261.1 hypothetical protein [Clostridium botulinum]